MIKIFLDDSSKKYIKEKFGISVKEIELHDDNYFSDFIQVIMEDIHKFSTSPYPFSYNEKEEKWIINEQDKIPFLWSKFAIFNKEKNKWE